MKSEKMSEVEKIIYDLENVKANLNIQYHNAPLSNNVDNAIKLLRTLQPSDHGELVKELVHFKSKEQMLSNMKQPGKVPFGVRQHNPFEDAVKTLDKAIAALSAPTKFDVVEYLRDGGKIQKPNDYGYYAFNEKDKFYFKGIVEDDVLGEQDVLIPDVSISELIKIKDWQPYEPEPTAAELIENARIKIMDLTVPNGIEPVMTPIIDLLERLTLEQSKD